MCDAAPPAVQLRMIDFAHVEKLTGKGGAHDPLLRDQSYLKGLHTLREALDELLNVRRGAGTPDDGDSSRSSHACAVCPCVGTGGAFARDGAAQARSTCTQMYLFTLAHHASMWQALPPHPMHPHVHFKWFIYPAPLVTGTARCFATCSPSADTTFPV